MSNIYKKLVALASAILLVVGINAQTISIETVTGIPGTSVAVPVNAQSLSDVAAFQWTIEYDETQLTFVSIDNWASGVNQTKLTINSGTAGIISIVYNDFPNGFDITNGKFFDLNFDVKTAASGTTDITWSDDPTAREVSNSVPATITVTWNSGSVNIDTTPSITISDATGVPGSSVVVPVNARNLSEVTAFQWTIEYDDTKLTYTGSSGWDPEIDPANVTISDDGAGTLTFIYNEYPAVFSVLNGKFFDLNFDVNVGATGTAALTWSDVPTVREVSDAVPQEIPVSWTDGSVIINSAPTITIAEVTGTPGSAVAVPVSAQNLAGITSFQWSVKYDDSKLSYDDCTDWGGGITGTDVIISDDGAGTLTFVYNEYPATFDITDGVFFNLNFTADVSATGVAEIFWSDDTTPREVAANTTPVTVTWGNGRVLFGSTWTGAVSSDWLTAGNWMPEGVPGSLTNVVIPDVAPNSFPVIDDAATTVIRCNDLIIENGATLTVALNGQMTVLGELTNNNGTSGLVVQSNAAGTGSLILNNAGVQGTFQQYLSHTNGEEGQWHFVGSPVTAAPVSLYGGLNFFEYVESVNDWWLGSVYEFSSVSGWQAPSGNMQTGKGYIKYSTENTINYEGEYNFSSEDLIYSVPYTVHAGDAPNTVPYTDLDGWNLVSNPYQSAIDWLRVKKSAKMNMNVYYYDDDGGNYVYYLDNGDGTGLSLNAATQYIPAGQGFFVKAAAGIDGSITIPVTSRVHSSQMLWKNQTPKEITENQFLFSLSHQGRTDECFLHFHQNATSEFSDRYDVYKRFSWDETMPQIFTLSGDNAVHTAIKAYGIDTSLLIPVGFKVPEAGEYTVDFSQFESNHFDYVVWEDLAENKVVNISESTSYTFSSEAGLFENRFQLHFGINQAPQVVQPIANIEYNAEESFNISAEAVFVDNDIADDISLQVFLNDGSSLPQWLSFDAQSMILSGMAQNSDTGVYEILLRATDGFGETAESSFLLEILYVNHSPVVQNPIETQIMPTGINWAVNLPDDIFTDSDPNDELAVAVQIPQAISEWLTYDPEQNSLVGTLPVDALGSFMLSATATDPFGEMVSTDFALDILAPLSIVQQPEDLIICPEENAFFYTNAEGTDLIYQWQFMGTDIPGANSPSLFLETVSWFDEGQYSCIVSDIFDLEQTAGAVLELKQAVSIIEQPFAEIVFHSGDSVQLTINAEGTNLSFQWRKDNQNISDNERISGSKESVLNIEKMLAEDAGLYNVAVSGDCGSEISQNSELLYSVSSDQIISEGASLYPNPAQDFIQIRPKFSAGKYTFSIYDVSGMLVLKSEQKQSGKLSLDIRHLASGLYFIEFKYDNEVHTEKIIKQ